MTQTLTADQQRLRNEAATFEKLYGDTVSDEQPALAAYYAAMSAITYDKAGTDPDYGPFYHMVGAAIGCQHDLDDKDAGLRRQLAELLERHDNPFFWSSAYNRTHGSSFPELSAFYAVRCALAWDKQAGLTPRNQDFLTAVFKAVFHQHDLADKDVGLRGELADLLEWHDDLLLWNVAHASTDREKHPTLEAFYAMRRAMSSSVAGVASTNEDIRDAVRDAVSRLPTFLSEEGEAGKQNRKIATRLVELVKGSYDVGLCREARNGAVKIEDGQKGKDAWIALFAANLFFVSAKQGSFFGAKPLTEANSLDEYAPPSRLSRRDVWKRMREARLAQT